MTNLAGIYKTGKGMTKVLVENGRKGKFTEVATNAEKTFIAGRFLRCHLT